ncbi:MAG: peptide-methionine (R)-S-oxide reductase MsrB [Tissierellia bacterium]|nr:peptide-methionine (R)-S-oxide reductase MsrB [Tissierellia bacterium]
MKKILLLGLLLMIFLTACTKLGSMEVKEGLSQNHKNEEEKQKEKLSTLKKNESTIYLAGGCFWGVEGYFKELNGVLTTEVGYANGKTSQTRYEDIKRTDHAEAVEVIYDKNVISLEEILLHYFRIIDPLSVNQQGNDRGRQYRTGVYYTDDSDREIIDRIFTYEERIHGKLAVERQRLKNFIPGEEYHQDYLEKNPGGYCHIDLSRAKDPLFNDEYPLPDEENLKKILDEQSYKILRQSDTELPHSSKLNEEYRRGIYVDKATGEPLFVSQDKFDSGCGWPSFSKPILNDTLQYRKDQSLGMSRVEVRSKGGHLGHVFEDGPQDKGGLRYCINGSALEFIPYEEMEEKGYGNYKILCH